MQKTTIEQQRTIQDAMFTQNEYSFHRISQIIKGNDIEALQQMEGAIKEQMVIPFVGRPISVLYYAIKNNRTEIVEYLLEIGIGFPTQKSKSLSFHCICSKGYAAILEKLIETDDFSSLSIEEQKTLLRTSLFNGQEQIYNILSSHGVMLNEEELVEMQEGVAAFDEHMNKLIDDGLFPKDEDEDE